MTVSIAEDTPAFRRVRRIVTARPVIEGEGFEVRRALPGVGGDAVGPFILLDHLGPVTFAPGEAKGAPNHPHRGFETLTYLIEGSSQHCDSLGTVSSIGAGEAQWMRAGRGIMHGEGADEAMQREGGRMHGAQFWINLPRGRKMSPPRHQTVRRDMIPQLPLQDGSLRLIAGVLGSQRGPVTSFTDPWLAFIDFSAEGSGDIEAAPAELALYVLSGEILVGDTVAGAGQCPVREGELAILSQGEVVSLRAPSDSQAFLFGGDALDAPIRRWGPFVMNTDQELQQTMRDYQAGLFGTIPPRAKEPGHD
jgi:redox-sensitive bicupin YhaK (pirin superfamily)